MKLLTFRKLTAYLIVPSSVGKIILSEYHSLYNCSIKSKFNKSSTSLRNLPDLSGIIRYGCQHIGPTVEFKIILYIMCDTLPGVSDMIFKYLF